MKVARIVKESRHLVKHISSCVLSFQGASRLRLVVVIISQHL